MGFFKKKQVQKKINDDNELDEFAKYVENKANDIFRDENVQLKKSIVTDYDKMLYDTFTYNSRFFKSWVENTRYTDFIYTVPTSEQHQVKIFLILILMVSNLFNEQDRSMITDTLNEIIRDIDIAQQSNKTIPEIILDYFNYVNDFANLNLSKSFILECCDQISRIITN